MSDRVGPVIMAHPIARACLESGGVVHSFRTSDRTTGETHYRYERTGTKQGDVEIKQETDEILPTVENLQAYVDTSGFMTPQDWQDAIREVHGSLDEPGYIYQVVLTDE